MIQRRCSDHTHIVQAAPSHTLSRVQKNFLSLGAMLSDIAFKLMPKKENEAGISTLATYGYI